MSVDLSLITKQPPLAPWSGSDWLAKEVTDFIKRSIAEGLTDDMIERGCNVIFEDHERRFPWVGQWMGMEYAASNN